jgi:NADP-dependent 3-hydroxy acid dehydrogenase YdfG
VAENQQQLSNNLQKEYVIVTGASRGSGEGISKVLSRSYNVIAVSRDLKRMNEVFQGYENILPYKMDITDSKSIEEISLFLSDKNVRALVNNAGGGGGNTFIENDSAEAWQYAYNLNVVAPMVMSKAIIPHMKKNGIGDIIVITSIAGLYPYKGGGNYVVAKRAEGAFAETLRMEVSGQGIKVTQIIPGAIDTKPEFPQEIATKPEDIGEAVRWIISLPNHVNVDQMTIMHTKSERYQ